MKDLPVFDHKELLRRAKKKVRSLERINARQKESTKLLQLERKKTTALEGYVAGLQEENRELGLKQKCCNFLKLNK